MTAVADSLRQQDEPDCFIDPQYGYWCNPGSWFLTHLDSASFAYDAVGNRTDSGADTDTGNRLTDLGDYSFTHDDEGRTRTKNRTGLSQTFYWNARGQLDSVGISELVGEFWQVGTVRYTYDGLGRRISREGPGGFEEYLYDGPHVIAILDDEQDVVSTLSYYPGVDKPHSLMTDAETYYYATDHTGSVSGLLDYSGTPDAVNTYRYDVWGRPQVATEAVPNPIRFKARWWDPDTELLDFRARWYDPDIGRFISEDPIGLAGGINVYRFVGNDPISGWDPFGMFDPDDGCEEGEPVTAQGIPVLEPIRVCVDRGPGRDPFGGGDTFGDPIGPGPAPSAGKRGSPGGGGSGTGTDPDRDGPTCGNALAVLGYNVLFDIPTARALKVGAPLLFKGGAKLATTVFKESARGFPVPNQAIPGRNATRRLVEGARPEFMAGGAITAAALGTDVETSTLVNIFATTVKANVQWQDFVPFLQSGRAALGAIRSCF